ncbi:hypothetical protein FE257_007117 [Aspergillus nanangensis]|uniref:Uncharacterized protein n=1 Tax=Aspergillus nanangensis TaxID=2582783 RepID=A0AAD4CN61_ASPNN|nr:hypothetical protein FE257_007117 [Aspergillus nanangensis]
MRPLPRKIQWKNEQRPRAKRKVKKPEAPPQNIVEQEVIEEQVERGEEQALVPAAVGRWLAPIIAQEVAPVMVVLDHVSNGYRELLLPMACQDDVLQRAINAVAAQHLAGRDSKLKSVAESERSAVISRLRHNSLQTSADLVFNVSTWATLIVLLVGETITGSTEYSYLLQTLMCLAQNIGRVEHTAANSFLMQQTHMFQLLGLPMLGETQGIDALQLPIEQYLDWTVYDLPPESQHHRVLSLSRLAFMKASQIYLGRATIDQDQWAHLESLKEIVNQVDPDEPGAHALVWVCFMAAADSTDPEHRRFFTDRLIRVYAKTRFRNISAAIDSLPALWSLQGSGRWTEELIRLSPTLVM